MMKPFETLTVGGSEYRFKITTANAVKLEEELGTNLLSGLEKLGEIKVLAKYFYYAAVSLNDSVNSIDDVYTFFDDYITEGGDYEALRDLVIEIMLTSGILSKEMYDTSKKLQGEQKEALQKLLK